MGLLSELLEQVAAREPSEVLIATERPLTLVHARGTESIGGLVTDQEVYDALSELLTPEQQAELAVGRRVELELSAGSERWWVVAETGTDTISIRAQPASDRDGLGADEVVVIFPTDAWGGEGRDEVSEVEVDIEVEEEDADDVMTRRHSAIRLRRAAVRGRPRRCAVQPIRGGVEASAEAEVWRDAKQLAAALAPGTLCFLHWAPGMGATIARSIHRSVLVIDEASDEASARRELPGLEEGAVIVVALEDPSPWLPWLLRRIEEGMRVLVETRATSHEGALRILLGVGASARAEAWLDAVRVISAALRNGRWSVVA